MAKSTPKSIMVDTYTDGIFGRTEGYADRVRQLYAQAVAELLKLAASQGVDEDEMFEFDKLPKKLKEEANKILRLLYSSVYNEVQHGIRAEWEYANLSNDIIIKRIFGDAVFKNEGNHFARWFGRNQQAMDAFLKRKSGPQRLGLSERIWNYTGQLRDEMELALSVSMGEGKSAASISREVRQYLQEPDRLFRRVRGADGKLRWSKAAREYLKTHDVGRGQYLSSYKNAMRLTRTETNMAYRASDHERWQQLDFVLGVRIALSNNHTTKGDDGRPEKLHDICDELKGDYPKTFKFTGWHPQCRCVATPILATPDEMVAMRKAMREGKDPRSVLAAGRYITEPPAAFTQWISDNRERIENASSVPYFIRDNFKDGDIDKGYAWIKTKKQKTQEEKQAVIEKWNERKRHNTLITKMGNNVYNVAAGYPDVDTADLVAAINSGNIAKIEEQARAVAKQVAALNKQLKGMTGIIDNPKQWLSQGFKVSELQKVHDAVESKMAEWTAKYQGDSYLTSNYTLEKYLLKKLAYEITDVEDKKKYNTWQVAQQAYAKQQTDVQDKIVWQEIQEEEAVMAASLSKTQYAAQFAKVDQAIKNKDKDAAWIAIAELGDWEEVDKVLKEALTFKTKSQPYLDLIARLQKDISSSNLSDAQATVALMQAKRAELKKKADRRHKGNDTSESIKFGAECFTKARKDKAVWHIDADSATDYFFPMAVEGWNQWTKEEKYALWNYTAGSRYMTCTLRGFDGWCYEVSARQGINDIKRDIPQATSAISKTRFKEDAWIKRDDTTGLTANIFGLPAGYFEKLRKEIENEEQRIDKLFKFSARLKAFEDFESGGIYGSAEAIKNEPLVKSEYEELVVLPLSSPEYRDAYNKLLKAVQKAKKQIEEEKKNALSAFATSKLVGRTGTDESFGSCGNCRNTYFGSKNVVWNIYCPKGTMAAYVEPFSEFGHGHTDGSYSPKLNWNGKSKPEADNSCENEIIMQRGTTYRITKVELSLKEDSYGYKVVKWYIDLEVIAQNPRPIKEYRSDRKGEYDSHGWYAVFE